VKTVYLESSAVGRGIIHGDLEASARLHGALSGGGKLVTSALTFAELERACLSAVRGGRLTAEGAREARRLMTVVRRRAHIIRVDEGVLRRAAKTFEVEPVRALDAIHLASILLWDEDAGGELAVFTRDRRVQENAVAYGFAIL
jgi:predicted nucleic acid-binding protein